jgi:hypothetical protein
MDNEKKQSKPKKQMITSQTITAFSDIAQIAVRNDDMVFMQFFSDTPETIIENFRTMMPKKHAIKLIDILAVALDYYPSKGVDPKVITKFKKTRMPKQ